LTIDGDLIRIAGADHSRTLEIDVRQIKRASFNSNNGLWAIRSKDGRRVRFQSGGTILPADRSDAGRQICVAGEARLIERRLEGAGWLKSWSG
jgi:hypothetical protein